MSIDHLSNKLLKIFYQVIKKKKKVHICYKKCNKHTANTFPNKLVSISKNKIKGKSRCAICLTERTFIDEVKYDLESALEIYFKFFTDWYYKYEKYTIRS